MEEKQELVFKSLRALCIKLNELLTDSNNKLAAPVFMTIFPDGEIYVK